jgi:hypothetical protein
MFIAQRSYIAPGYECCQARCDGPENHVGSLLEAMKRRHPGGAVDVVAGYPPDVLAAAECGYRSPIPGKRGPAKPVLGNLLPQTPIIATRLLALPSASMELPSIGSLAPFMLPVMTARALPLPMPACPHVPPSVPIPISWGPRVTATRGVNPLVSWRRGRINDNDVGAGASDRLGRQENGRTDRHHGNSA